MYFHIFSKIYLVLIQKELDYKRKCTAKILVVMSNKQNQNFCKNAIKIVFVRSFEIGQRICINVQLISSIKRHYTYKRLYVKYEHQKSYVDM